MRAMFSVKVLEKLCCFFSLFREVEFLRVPKLGGGFKYFLFSSRSLGMIPILTVAYFSTGLGKNHQLEKLGFFLKSSNGLNEKPLSLMITDQVGQTLRR